MILVDGVARQIDGEGSSDYANSQFDLLVSSYDNSGNTVHAEAPFSLWDDGTRRIVDGREYRRRHGFDLDQTIDFANREASHYVLSATNFILFDGDTEARREAYLRLVRSLDRLKVPLVVIGLGVQAPRRWNPTNHHLPPEAVDFIKFVGEKCELVGVRGEFTASIFRDYGGVHNTSVIGCPSFFQRPRSFSDLRQFLKGSRPGSVSFNATNFGKPAEQVLMNRAIREDSYWLEVHNESVHAFALEAMLHPELAEVPKELRWIISSSDPLFRRAELVDYFVRRYRRFRDLRSWGHFNREQIRFSYGTRFHGNMAAVIAGRPALWIAHDSRTSELVETLHLPSVTLTQAVESTSQELEAMATYDDTFDHLAGLFDRFNGFLSVHNLPTAKLAF